MFSLGMGQMGRVGSRLSKLAGASLNLDFTSSSQALDPRVTFTRASNATRVNASGLIELVAVNEPRFDYDPVTLAPKGLLIEEQRTNSIRNNTMVGAVAGTPGTLPTNWSVFTSLTGLTRQVVGTGTEDGVNYVDVRISGTPSAAGSVSYFTDASTAVAAAAGQTWTESAYFKLQAGSLAGVTSVRLYFQENNSGGGYLVEQNITLPAPTTASLASQRFSASRTLANASTAFLMPGFNLLLSGAAIDITLRIGLPQLEQGAFATSVIPTSGTAATRAADVAVMTEDNFSSWYRQDEGTLFVEATGVNNISGATRRFAEITSGVATDRMLIGYSATNITRFLVVAGSVIQADIGVSAVQSGEKVKMAASYSASSLMQASNSILGPEDTLATLPSVGRLLIGGDGSPTGGNTTLNGHIRRIAYFPRRLANSELQALTS